MNKRLFKIFALMLALALAFAFPASAFAEDDMSSSSSAASATAEPATSVDTNPENIVDPTQRADNSFIYDTTIEDVLAETSLHDGRIVQFVGEAIIPDFSTLFLFDQVIQALRYPLRVLRRFDDGRVFRPVYQGAGDGV